MAKLKIVFIVSLLCSAVASAFLFISDGSERAAIRAKLAQNRASSLAHFKAYQAKGMFPRNVYTNGKLNVWRDEDGNLCAAATILNASGYQALVQKIAKEDNFIRLADVRSGPLMEWILTSGLTQEEIAAIQEVFYGDDGDRSFNGWPLKEDERLKAVYKDVEAKILEGTDKSLDLATDRLMANPDLARRLIS